MPRSKHRRKFGGKAVRNPGRSKEPAGRMPIEQYAETPEEARRWKAEDRLYRAYVKEVRQAFPNDPDEDAAFVAETLLSYALQFRDGAAHLEPVDRHVLVAKCCDGGADDEIPPLSTERVQAILAQFTASGLVETPGEQIAVPARFLIAA